MYKKQDALVPVFGALCFFLSAIEFVIPKPLPFLRIGLANVPLLLALDVVSSPEFLLLAVIKILGQAFISGTLFSYLIFFSAAGTLGAAFTMYALHAVPRKALSLAGISMAGAAVSNAIQLAIGRFFLFGEGIWYMLPPFRAESEWYAQIMQAETPLSIELPDDTLQTDYPRLRLVSGSALLIGVLFIPGLLAKAVILCAGLLLCLAERQKIHWFAFFVSSAGIVLCHGFIPAGKELFSIGSFAVTGGALLNGLEKSVMLQAMIAVSRWTLQVRIRLPGLLGNLLDESLYIFRQLLEFKDRIRLRPLVTGIDELLLSLPYIVRQPESAD